MSLLEEEKNERIGNTVKKLQFRIPFSTREGEKREGHVTRIEKKMTRGGAWWPALFAWPGERKRRGWVGRLALRDIFPSAEANWEKQKGCSRPFAK